MKITQILVESQESLSQVGLDMKQIYLGALPTGLRSESNNNCDNVATEFFFDIKISVQTMEFQAHKVREILNLLCSLTSVNIR